MKHEQQTTTEVTSSKIFMFQLHLYIFTKISVQKITLSRQVLNVA